MSEPAARTPRWLIALFAAVAIVFMAVPIQHCIRGHSIKDYIVWYDAGQAVLHGTDVYPPLNFKFPFMYPPPCALFLAPLAALGKLGLISVLVMICASAWLASIMLSARLAVPRDAPVDPLVYLVPNVIVIVFVWGNFLLGQPSLLLLALMLGAFVSLQRNSQITAGVLIALAAAIKAFPAIVIVYLIYRRYWIAAVSLVLTLAFLLILLPAPFRGFALAKQDLARWSSGMLFKYDEGGVAQRAGRGNSWRNQSIWGVANRLLRHVESDPAFGPHRIVYSNFADLKFSTVNAIIVGSGLLFGLAYVAVIPRRSTRTAESDALEFAALLLLVLIFTPLTFGYLFAWLLYPFTVIVQRVLEYRSRRLLIFGSAAVSLLALTIPLRVVAQTYGNILLATVLLFVAIAWELWMLKTAAPAEAQA